MTFRPFVAASAAVVAFGLSAVPGAASIDVAAIGVTLDFPAGAGGAFYRLTGQSVFFSTRTSSVTTGGQLDGVTSYDSQNAVHQITFNEVFPEANLTDYAGFGYFGVIEAYAFDGDAPAALIAQGIVIAGRGLGAGTRVEDLFPGLTAASLLNALVTTPDSPEFFAALEAAVGNPQLNGLTGLLDSDLGEIRVGQSLSLYAFLPDPSNQDGPFATDVGFIDHTIVRVVPAPAAAGLFGLVGIAAARRRR